MKILPIFCLSCGGLLALAGCSKKVGEEPSSPPKVADEKISFPTNSPQLSSLAVEPVESRAPASAQLFGRLVWNDDVTVRVFTPFAGRVRKLMADLGRAVEKSEPLAEVESPDFGQAQADARKAESDWQLAERNLARLRELVAHGAAAKKDVEAAESDQARAGSERSRALSKLVAYGADGDLVDGVFVLKSPLAGTIVEKSVNPGQEIRPDQMLANAPNLYAPLFVVSDPSRLWIQIDATEIDLPHLQPGREFTFTSRAFPGQTFTGRVDNVSEFIDPNTRTIKVRGTVNNARRLLKAEMFVSVKLPGGETTAVSVPSKAVFLKGEKHYVFVEEHPGEFKRQEVAVRSEQDGRVLILSGLEPSQRVVTDGCILLQQMLE
jgi:cobalt-zinc-cadmium efflux system membrane fusion protein